MSKKQVFVFAFIGLLILSNAILLVAALFLFPEHWGSKRTMLFIHPDDSRNKGGYFLVIDELQPRSQIFDVDWVFHGRGEMEIGENLNSVKYSTQSYLSSDEIALNISFLSPIREITTHQGLFSPEEHFETDDSTPTYFKAKYAGSTNPIMGVVLYPDNEADATKTVPKMSAVGSNEIGEISESDLVYYQISRQSKTFSTPNDIVTDAKVFFVRKNTSDGIEYFFVQDSSEFSFEGIQYFKSTVPIDNLVINYDNYMNEISGIINLDVYRSLIEEELIEGELLVPHYVEIYVPFQAKNLTLDGADAEFTQTGSTLRFDLESYHQFHVSRNLLATPAAHEETNPLRNKTVGGSYPNKQEWEFDIDTINELDHPYLLFNESELTDLKYKINNPSKPWKEWYDSYTSNIDSLVATAISSWDEDERVYPTRALALKYAISGSGLYLNKLKNILLDMRSVQNSYSQDLRRSYAVQAYSIAYDIIREDISPEERTKILDLLEEHAYPLSLTDLYSDNNHIVVDAGGLGLAGLVLKNKEFIDIAIESILNYLYKKVRADGASYEGQSYLGFAWRESMEFMTALKRLGGYNFFNDTRYLNSLNFMANSFSPLSTPPLFEDATTNPRCNDILLMAASQIENQENAQEYQWLWELRSNNKDLLGLNDYDYLLGASPSDRRIYCYRCNNKLIATQPDYTSQVYKDSNMAILRSGSDTNSIYMSFSCKNYSQSHPHYDENSFEIWAYGAWLAINPGYPGWGKEGHNFAVSTEASNTLLINNYGQLYPHAGGLKSSIISPYFDMIKGDATRAYNSPGSMAESLQPYMLIIIMFVLFGISLYLIGDAKRDVKKWIQNEEEYEDALELQNISIMKDKRLHFQEYSRANFFNDIFRHPKPVQKKVFLLNQENHVKILNLIFSGFVVAMVLIQVLYILSKLNYHLAYFETKYAWIVNFIPLVEVIVLVIILIAVYLFYHFFIRFFARMCNYICADCDERFPNYRRKISNSFSVAITWQIFLFGVATVIIWFTIMWSTNYFIHDIFTKVGGMSEVVFLFFSLMGQSIVVFLFISIFEITFFVITLQSMGYAISLMSEARIRPRDGVKVTIACIFVIFCILCMLILAMFFGIAYFISSLGGIEALVSF